MKRLSFLTALLGIGVAKAQEMVLCGSSDPKVCTDILEAKKRHAKPKPANGECPVCGTMADPYRPEKVTKWRDNCPPPPTPTSLVGCIGGGWVDATPTARAVTCAHCRVLFQQEAEKA